MVCVDGKKVNMQVKTGVGLILMASQAWRGCQSVAMMPSNPRLKLRVAFILNWTGVGR